MDREPARIARANIEVHERLVAAVAQRTVPEDLLAVDFRMDNRIAAAIDYTYRGVDGWREWMSDLFEGFAGPVSYRVDELIAAGPDFVAATFKVSGRSTHTSEPLELSWAGVTWFRDGRATRAVGYRSREHAIKALELAAEGEGSER